MDDFETQLAQALAESAALHQQTVTTLHLETNYVKPRIDVNFGIDVQFVNDFVIPKSGSLSNLLQIGVFDHYLLMLLFFEINLLLFKLFIR